MIVRNRKDSFVMIEQHIHGQASGDIMSQWKDSIFLGKEWRKSVEFAIYHHDLGWELFDQQPFWDDDNQMPYTFSSFPTLPKLVLYKHGIDAVEKEDPYAALLCSEHYTRFLVNNTSQEAQAFVRSELTRQKHLKASFSILNKRLFNFHYGLLQLGDNLSLYLCLNEPGIEKEKEHPFFKEGIPLNSALIGLEKSKLNLEWLDSYTVLIDEFPFEQDFQVSWKQKIVRKSLIYKKGLLTAYNEAPYEKITVTIQSK